MMFTTTSAVNPLREAITDAYRMEETTCLQHLIAIANTPGMNKDHLTETAKQLVIETREYKKKQGKIDTLLHQYDLSTEEGISLMCLAEALLRIPDKSTIDKLIGDKISTVEWNQHLNRDNSLFVNAATWSLLLTGKIYAPTLNHEQSLIHSLKRTVSRLGIGLIRPIIMQMMKAIGKQFVMGESIETALTRARAQEKMGYTFSYDMLGEAARTKQDADHYYALYASAIDAIGNTAASDKPENNPGISIKLSALHPRYDYTHRERVLKELPPLLLALANQAKKYHIGLTIDAEETDRLDLSLDIFEMVYSHPTLAQWNGLGLAVQAYQKRASFVIDWLAQLAAHHGKRIMVRLVKGAYWDAEIKASQLQGYTNYPVFTRKDATDVSYLACAKKLLTQSECFYPQFGTHNAYSVAAIMKMASPSSTFEFQCLHGMGRPLYDQIIGSAHFKHPCRIYAPVGTHQNLLGYLVRRLLENGANSSFVNRLANESLPIEKIVYDPIARISTLHCTPHPRIPLPKHIYSNRQNSQGIDLSDPHQYSLLQQQMAIHDKTQWKAGPIVNGKCIISQNSSSVCSPNDIHHIIGKVTKTEEIHIEEALTAAHAAVHSWSNTPVTDRAIVLERAAELFQQEMPVLISLLNQEAGKCLPDCISEIRESIDYCRYYAQQAREILVPSLLEGPTGETNQLSYHARGIMTCISPWNFPLAIFLGQIIAALAAGNTVIAKPSEQTPLIAFKAVQILHQAGIPRDVLHLLIGPGSVVGAKLAADPRVAGVIFTGSTETAKTIERTLSHRQGPIALFIAETGGQNAMIVDSSALAEQAVLDIIQSAFNSAGQRCSALRVLFVQEDIASTLLTMLLGYMAELTIGDPRLLSTDIGPVIDTKALDKLKSHFAMMSKEATLLGQASLQNAPAGHYFAPCVFELSHLNILKEEVFGPILHVIRYQAGQLDQVLDDIINTGYGLTLGIHSRIETTISHIVSRMPIGNIYVNRNMIGAVVGVQPFGGEKLSGTGPKAGGPHYIPRLCVERCISVNTTAVGGNARLVSLLEDDECQNFKASLM
jgi:RHH-type proline utilization regulon transcriptional repressor/proline dehydrogenase/delta 1-pyrroline-5-carboxylate dehydrogenase